MNLMDRIEAVVREFSARIVDEVLRTSLEDVGAAARRPETRRRASSGRAPKIQAAATTPKMAAARKIQGRYIGMLRHLREAWRPGIRKIAKEKGVRAAVAAMDRLRSAKGKGR